MDKVEFVKKYYPLAKQAGDEYGLNPVVILAQAGIESQWGSSYGARVRRNFFGIIASGPTNKYWDGSKNQSTVSGLWFRVYRTDLDSFLDFARLITSRYKSAASVSSDTAAYAHAIAYSPYITETYGDNRPVYEKTVAQNAEFIKKLLGPQLLRDEKEREKKS